MDSGTVAGATAAQESCSLRGHHLLVTAAISGGHHLLVTAAISGGHHLLVTAAISGGHHLLVTAAISGGHHLLVGCVATNYKLCCYLKKAPV
ncbi:hypothetical protein Pcinc_000213 [Petrolisthes cinctipes]|uniref:Uncharacterized protein n=1 Tax=Petrolisthes cinctipes TaxID=88211 RepID=A0AAE1GNQ8_PETCI|nr:hypothetical protein Pcinc_000213 [Petrolisthes cinctipes]